MLTIPHGPGLGRRRQRGRAARASVAGSMSSAFLRRAVWSAAVRLGLAGLRPERREPQPARRAAPSTWTTRGRSPTSVRRRRRSEPPDLTLVPGGARSTCSTSSASAARGARGRAEVRSARAAGSTASWSPRSSSSATSPPTATCTTLGRPARTRRIASSTATCARPTSCSSSSRSTSSSSSASSTTPRITSTCCRCSTA